jgi:uncharacterized membrane protein YkoI
MNQTRRDTMLSRTKQVAGLTLWCGVALVLAAGGLRLKAEGQADKERKAALPAERVVASIWAAVAAKPGDVRAVEVEKKGDKLICEVEVLTLEGKTYEVEVDVATNTVLEVEDGDD